MPMQRTPIDHSSTITGVGYDADASLLEVTFKSGDTYRYAGVTQDAYDKLMAPGSIGSNFRQHIKDGGFEYERVQEKEEE
jgi:hypothetical protein